MIPITIDELIKCDKSEMAFLFGKPVVLSYARIIRDTLPEGFYAYDIRHSDYDWGNPIELSEEEVRCNYFGTIITNKKLNIDFTKNYVKLICDENTYDIDYLETIADLIYEDPEDDEDNYAWNLEGYIQRSADPEYRDTPYEIPEGRILSKHENTETQKEQDTEDS